VANHSQSIVITWGSATLGEVVGVSVGEIVADLVDVTPKNQLSRQKRFDVADSDAGSITLRMRATTAASATCTGTSAVLGITGPDVAWSFTAVYERLGWAATVGQFQEYNVTFKVSA
jgi:Na+/glutamate symporter